MAATSWKLERSLSGNSTKLSHPMHACTLLTSLNEIRKCHQLCDGIVIVGDVEIAVQRNILAAASPYFRALYNYEEPFTSAEKANLNMASEHISPEVFNQILDYVYTADIELSEDSIQSVLQAADVLLMCDLKELCCEYLEQCITVSNCLGIREFTERFSCPRVNHAATEFMDENFMEVSYSEEFMQLPENQLILVLQRDSLVIQTEDAIFDCVMRWVRHDADTRKESLNRVLTACVYFGLLDERYVQEQVIGDDLIRGCQLEKMILQKRRDAVKRKHRGYTNMIVMTGGEGPCPGDPRVVEIKSCVRCVPFHNHPESKACHWIDLAPMTQPRIGHGMVEAGGCLYVVGGRDNSGRILNTGEKYSPSSNTWTPISPMHHARVGFGLVTIEDRIYALGGSNDMSDPLTSMEEYNIYTNQWRQLPDMNLKRAWSACTTCNKKIYVIGGGVMGKLYEAVECFDPRSETWVSVAPMKERRFDARAIGFGDDVFVFGGLRRLECPSAMSAGSGMKFCTTEIYSTEQKHWMLVGRDHGFCTMTDTCHIDAIAKCNDEIILIGDLDIGGRYNCIRAFRPSTNCWRGVALNHPPEQRGMQGCILKVPTSMVYDLISQSPESAQSFP